MDSRQLRDVLSRDLGRSFVGVYPRDLLPNQLRPYEKAIVVYTDYHNQPGTHWVCLYWNGARFLRITSPAPRNSSSLDTLDIGLTITIVIRIIVCIFYTNAIEDTDEIVCFHSQGRQGYPRFNEIIM